MTDILNIITTLSTLAAVLAALAIAIWGDRLKEWGGYKTDVEIVDKLENIQENTNKVKQGQTRLVFLNNGKATAKDVEVYINKIWDGKDIRTDFLPVPLSWTHDGRSKRTLHPNQYGYLDFCRIEGDPKKVLPKFVLSAGGGIPSYEDIKIGTTVVELIAFQESGQIKKYKIVLEWKSTFSWVKVVKMTKIQ